MVGELNAKTRVQILNKTFHISCHANAPEKIPSISSVPTYV